VFADGHFIRDLEQVQKVSSRFSRTLPFVRYLAGLVNLWQDLYRTASQAIDADVLGGMKFVFPATNHRAQHLYSRCLAQAVQDSNIPVRPVESTGAFMLKNGEDRAMPTWPLARQLQPSEH
jgi:hypothetical protein